MRSFLPLLTFFAFLGGCTFSTPVWWSVMERKAIQEVTDQVPDGFPVLGRDLENDDRVVVLEWGADQADHWLRDFPDEEVVNQQLREALGPGASKDYRYFRGRRKISC